MKNKFEIYYHIAFPPTVYASYFMNAESIGTTSAIAVAENILQMFSWDQKRLLTALLRKNEDIKNISRIFILKNDESVLEKKDTDTISWEIANQIFDEISPKALL